MKKVLKWVGLLIGGLLVVLVAQKRFANFTDPEIAALFAYLRNRAGLDAAAVGVP